MSIPFNDNLIWDTYQSNPDWHKDQPDPAPTSLIDRENQIRLTVNEVFRQTISRGVQFIRDAARLVLKVPIRAILTPIVLPKNWKERERAKINAKLTGYSLAQLVSVPVKFIVALTALVTSSERVRSLFDKCENFTTHLDGRAAQLEALKEVGRVNASTQDEYNLYKIWLYSIDSKVCRKEE